MLAILHGWRYFDWELWIWSPNSGTQLLKGLVVAEDLNLYWLLDILFSTRLVLVVRHSLQCLAMLVFWLMLSVGFLTLNPIFVLVGVELSVS